MEDIKQKGMKVLSLCDGMSCGQLALKSQASQQKPIMQPKLKMLLLR